MSKVLIDYKVLAGDCQILTDVFGLIRSWLGEKSAAEQARIIGLICAKRDELGWYTPIGQELLEILLDYFQEAVVGNAQEGEGIDLGELASQIAGRLETRLYSVRPGSYPPKSARNTGAEMQ